MAFPKPSAQVTQKLEEAIGGLRAAKRPMFGCPSYFSGDNMFAGVFGESLIIRLDEGQRSSFLKAFPGSGPFEPFPGRPMREYLALPLESFPTPAELGRWLGRAHAYAASLPAKPKAKQKTDRRG